MIKILLLLVIIAGVILHVHGDRECSQWGVTFKEGEQITVPNQCMRATCLDGLNNDISLSSCRSRKVGGNCYMSSEDRQKPYPECCPQPVCPKG